MPKGDYLSFPLKKYKISVPNKTKKREIAGSRESEEQQEMCLVIFFPAINYYHSDNTFFIIMII